jgi:hypothetical protein
MALDPKGAFEAGRVHAHRARKSAGRLAISGLGFSVAYFFDPDHGSARRQQAREMVGHARRVKAQLKNRRGQRHATSAPTATMRGTTTSGPVAPLYEVRNGSRASSRS